MDLNAIELADHGACEVLTGTAISLGLASRAQRRVKLRTGQTLWHAADTPAYVYTLEPGRVEITETDRQGRLRLCRVVEPGEMFGYLCFCSHRFEPMETEARATCPSEVQRNGREEFRRRLAHDEGARARLLETLCARVSESNRRASMLAIHDAQRRLATLLLQMVATRTAGQNAPDSLASLRVSHAELAAQAALTRSHTTVVMTRLRGLGCVRYGRGTHLQIDTAALGRLLQ